MQGPTPVPAWLTADRVVFSAGPREWRAEGFTVMRCGRFSGFGVVVVCLVLGGCTGGGSGGSGGRSNSGRAPVPEVAGTATPGPAPERTAGLASRPMSHKYGPAHVELLALRRTSGSVVTGRFRVVNDGPGTIDLTSTFSEEYRYRPGDPVPQGEGLTVSGIGLLDPVGNKLYLPLSTDDGECLCSRTFSRVLRPGRSGEVYAMFPAPPAEVTRVTVTMPLTVPFEDVPLDSGPVGTPPDVGSVEVWFPWTQGGYTFVKARGIRIG